MIQHCSGFPHTKLLCLQHGDFKRSTLGEGEKGERKEGEREGEREGVMDGWRGERGREGGREGRRERGIGGEGRQRGRERGMNGEGGREGWMEREGWRGMDGEGWMEDEATKSPTRYLESRPTRISGTLYSGMNLRKKSLVMRR